VISGGAAVSRLAVVGAGVIGVGVAALATGHGMPVLLLEIDAARRRSAAERVRRQLLAGRLLDGLPRNGPVGELTTGRSVEEAAAATTVIESVVERPDVKRRVLKALSAVVTPGTLLASTTSAIPIAELAVATGRPAETVGLHFMNPPQVIRLVEVARGPDTSDEAIQRARTLLASLGRQAVVVGDGPGFVANRILQRVINDAARMVQEGRAEAASVDAIFQGGLGHRSGPLATADLIGLDNVVDTLKVLFDRTGEAGYRPCELLVAKVRAGDLGRKTGRGFYEYERTMP
jgi:methoxymalonate biosynthesis protein